MYSYERTASFGNLTLEPPTGAPKLDKGQRVKIVKKPNVIKDDVGKVGEFQGYMRTQGAVVKIDGKEKLFPGSALKKVAKAGAPDPHSLKAFTSEYEMGIRRGQEENISGGPVHQYKTEAEDYMVEAATEVRDLMARVIQQGNRGTVRLNKNRFAAKLSQSLSTLFYEGGRAEGLDKGY